MGTSLKMFGAAMMTGMEIVAHLVGAVVVTVVSTGVIFMVDDGLTHYRPAQATVTGKHELLTENNSTGKPYAYAHVLDLDASGQPGTLAVDSVAYDKAKDGDSIPVTEGKTPWLGIVRIGPPEFHRPAGQHF